jgi:hypothetical protein
VLSLLVSPTFSLHVLYFTLNNEILNIIYIANMFCIFSIETLERRYRDFIHLHNAQLGNSSPLTLEQMVTESTRRENAKNGLAKKGNKSVQIANVLKSGKV